MPHVVFMMHFPCDQDPVWWILERSPILACQWPRLPVHPLVPLSTYTRGRTACSLLPSEVTDYSGLGAPPLSVSLITSLRALSLNSHLEFRELVLEFYKTKSIHLLIAK